MQQFLILALLVATTSAGVVNHQRCGGVGTFRELRIQDCEGAVCDIEPGKTMFIEADLIPSSASPSLTLSVYAEFLGNQFQILNVVLANSSVQGGVLYVVKFSIVPNDILSGNTIGITSSILHTDSSILEACVRNSVRIL